MREEVDLPFKVRAATFDLCLIFNDPHSDVEVRSYRGTFYNRLVALSVLLHLSSTTAGGRLPPVRDRVPHISALIRLLGFGRREGADLKRG